MPIKGRERRRLARIGKIHLGVKAKTDKGVEYPKAVDYFVVHADDTTPESSAVAFHEVYGDEPRELDIMFPTDDPQQWADEWYKMYSASWGLACRGDGETAQAKYDLDQDGPRPEGMTMGTWANSKTKAWVSQTIRCDGELCPMQTGAKPQCKLVMNLQFFLPKVRGIGVFQIDTGSFNSIGNIRDNVETIKAVTGGRIRGIPLKLALRPKEVVPQGGAVKKKTVWVLDISLPDVSLYELLRDAQKLPENMLMLPPPAIEEDAPDDLDQEPVFTGPTYEHGQLDGSRDEPPKASPVEVAAAASAAKAEVKRQPKTRPPSPAALTGLGNDRQGPNGAEGLDALKAWVPQNVGELFGKAWTEFRVTKTSVEQLAGALIREKKLGDAWEAVVEAEIKRKAETPYG